MRPEEALTIQIPTTKNDNSIISKNFEMAKKRFSRYWTLKKLISSICDRLLNRYDAFIIIAGLRGNGKSTLAIQIARGVRREMHRRGIDAYKFALKKDTIYTKEDTIKFFNKWKHTAVADEMINITFNRDFYDKDQKDIIKMINMNRDHNNLCLACVPRFTTLDSQIKNLCCMKIEVVRRGVAIIHTPNKTMYATDIWDEKLNEKIERGWLEKGKKPKFSRLTTYRGWTRFPALSEGVEKKYQEVKNEKRNVILHDKEILEAEEKKKPINRLYDALVTKQIKNMDMFNGMAISYGFNLETVKKKISRLLSKNKQMTKLSKHFYDDADAKKERIRNATKSEIEKTIAKVKSDLGIIADHDLYD